MRSLFASERQCIVNLMRHAWATSPSGTLDLFSEYVVYEPEDSCRPQFNVDFVIDFIDRRKSCPAHVATVSSVLPNTLGAEVCLIVEKETFAPLQFELMGGGAFPFRYFRGFASRIEEVVGAALAAAATRPETAETVGASLRSPRELARLTSIKRSAFARILVVHGDACFLYFPSESRPVMRGRRLTLCQEEDRRVDCYVDDGSIVCFDGWVHMNVPRTEEILVATQE